jgi:hypothetical protein
MYPVSSNGIWVKLNIVTLLRERTAQNACSFKLSDRYEHCANSFFHNSLIALQSFSFTQKIKDHSLLLSVRSIYKSDVPSSAKRTPAIARMPATVWMQATTVAPATSNSKDDNNIMNAHNSTNSSNSRNKSDNRTTNTVWMPAKAGMLLKSQMAVELLE